ncbi:DUF2690 domain-containing protein [Nonomuraea sp. H19]|uniref:DUF2690 domain-containing protein n=1 Tax=Nonomuraea sp. H19 TaxID=3452206 RepID=UPI003F89A3F4
MLRRLPLFMATAVVAATVAGVSPAASSTTTALACSGTSCNGKNPSTQGCSATATPRESFLHGGRYTVQLRYASACRSFWGRIVRDDCDLIQGFAHLRVQRRQWTTYGWYTTHTYYRIQSEIPCNGGVGYTYMVATRTTTTSGHATPGKSPRHRRRSLKARGPAPPGTSSSPLNQGGR